MSIPLETQKKRIIIHVDMDAFYASVETRDDPSLIGRPVIVGARPGDRGVVSTCNYEAREFGVRSGMNIKEAAELCPDAAFIRPNHAKYEEVSRQLHGIWDPYATVSQPKALDETYLDVTETACTFARARYIAKQIKERTLKELGLPCSVGLAYCMAAAKTASEEMKPDGYFEIEYPDTFVAMMSNRDVGRLYSVGPKTASKLRSMGIEKVRDIYDRRREVERTFGQHGKFIVGLSQGIDNREVTPYRPEDAKSISRETTFQKDVSDYMLLMDVLLLMSMDLVERMSQYHLKGTGIVLKITYSDTHTITRNTINLKIDSPMDIAHAAWNLLDGSGRAPVRRIGVGITNLSSDNYSQRTFFCLTDGDGEIELERNLARMSRRYGFDFLGKRDELFGREDFYELMEHMRRHCPNRVQQITARDPFFRSLRPDSA